MTGGLIGRQVQAVSRHRESATDLGFEHSGELPRYP
jgi:hypothetical protein